MWGVREPVPYIRLFFQTRQGGHYDTVNTDLWCTMSVELVAHTIFSFVSGLSIAITGFGCDATRELFAVLSQGPNAFPASSAINMGLSAGLVTAVQVGGMSVVLLAGSVC